MKFTPSFLDNCNHNILQIQNRENPRKSFFIVNTRSFCLVSRRRQYEFVLQQSLDPPAAPPPLEPPGVDAILRQTCLAHTGTYTGFYVAGA